MGKNPSLLLLKISLQDKFNVDFDGNFSDFGESLKSGLDNIAFLV